MGLSVLESHANLERMTCVSNEMRTTDEHGWKWYDVTVWLRWRREFSQVWRPSIARGGRQVKTEQYGNPFAAMIQHLRSMRRRKHLHAKFKRSTNVGQHRQTHDNEKSSAELLWELRGLGQGDSCHLRLLGCGPAVNIHIQIRYVRLDQPPVAELRRILGGTYFASKQSGRNSSAYGLGDGWLLCEGQTTTIEALISFTFSCIRFRTPGVCGPALD